MICLTGDVHHLSMKGADQPFLKLSEVDAAQQYIEIAEGYGIKTTLFLTGKSVFEERESVANLINRPGLEIGGHTYSAFRPKLFYKIYRRMFGLKNGPCFVQRHDIQKTVKIFLDCYDLQLKSWRNHAYRNDKNTYPLLLQNGIRFVSDLASPDIKRPFIKKKLIHVPINILPDHDFLYHGDRIPGSFDESLLLKTNFNMTAMTGEQWLRKVKEQVAYVTNLKGVATLLVHPACMEILDGFKIFKKLCEFLSDFQSVTMSETKDILC
jgi:hypothetical protein